jgi:hypothetical protein
MTGSTNSINRILIRAEYKGINSNNQEYTTIHDYYDFKAFTGSNNLQVKI